jgi:hypothetical protein
MERVEKTIQSSIAASLFENNKVHKVRMDAVDDTSKNMNAKLTKVEKAATDLKESMDSLEVYVKASLQEVQNAPGNKTAETGKPWRNDLIKVIENVKGMSDESTAANQQVFISCS